MTEKFFLVVNYIFSLGFTRVFRHIVFQYVSVRTLQLGIFYINKMSPENKNTSQSQHFRVTTKIQDLCNRR